MVDEPILTSGEVAGRLGVNVRTISKWAAAGVIKPAWRTPGGRHRWRWSQVVEQLRAAGVDEAEGQ